MKKQTKILSCITLLFFSFYLLGFLYPETWWSVHFMRFISPVYQILFLVVILLFLFKFFIKEKFNFSLIERIVLNLKFNILITLVICLTMLLFPMVADFYGDAYKFNKFLHKIPLEIPKETHSRFFSFSLSPWAGEGTVLAIITYIAYYFQVTYKTSFIIVNAFFGGLFVFTWLQFITNYIKDKKWQIIMVLSGITAPFMLLFYGHIEIYAPVLFVNLLWGSIAIHYIKTEKKYLLWSLILVSVVSIKLHTIGVLCIPSLGCILWKKTKGYYPNWKQVSTFIIAPIFIIGALAYFFIFKDHSDDRNLQSTTMAFDHIFLPLFSPEAPLDKYSLLSFNHFFDFFSVSLLWSPIALIILIYIVITYKKSINWNAPEIVIIGMAFLLFVTLLFMTNPLLGLPIDWDLFSLPAPFLLLLTGVIVLQLPIEYSSSKMLYVAGFFTILSLPVFIVHQSEKALSLRLEHVAIRMYNTYYDWTSQVIKHAYTLDDDLKINRLERGEQLLEKLAPIAQKDIDYEYGRLLIDQGRYFLRERNNPKKALEYFAKVDDYTVDPNAKLLTLESYFSLHEYTLAYQIAKELVGINYPNTIKALKMSLHCALEAELYQEAYMITLEILKLENDDKLSQEINLRLRTNDRIKELKLLFENPYR
ncbi:tetratricopeptide repeat protein [Aquimarina rhabdastrellae]